MSAAESQLDIGRLTELQALLGTDREAIVGTLLTELATAVARINDGLARLDQEANDRHKVPYAQVQWEADRVALLQRIEQTAFFQKIRGDLVVSLYNQKELWPKFGYEGSSAEHGGYIKRGFADIDWLPKV